MDDGWIDRYAAAWAHQADAGDAEHGQQHLAALLAFMAPNVEYEDVPTGGVFVGHDGVRDMAAAAHRRRPDHLTPRLLGPRFLPRSGRTPRRFVTKRRGA